MCKMCFWCIHLKKNKPLIHVSEVSSGEDKLRLPIIQRLREWLLPSQLHPKLNNLSSEMLIRGSRRLRKCTFACHYLYFPFPVLQQIVCKLLSSRNRNGKKGLVCTSSDFDWRGFFFLKQMYVS